MKDSECTLELCVYFVVEMQIPRSIQIQPEKIRRWFSADFHWIICESCAHTAIVNCDVNEEEKVCHSYGLVINNIINSLIINYKKHVTTQNYVKTFPKVDMIQ